MFQNGLGFTIKTSSTNSPWAYIWEDLLSEGFVRLRFGGLIFGRAYFFGGLLLEFYCIRYKKRMKKTHHIYSNKRRGAY